MVNGSICRDLRAFLGDQPDQKLVVGGPQLIYRTGPRFYKSTTVATMVGGPKDFGGTKELEDLKAGRIQELGGPK